MKITDVRAHVLEAKLAQPFAYSRMWYAKRMSMIVEVVTDDGLTGWGECYGPARVNAAVVRELGAHLIGQDPLRSEYLWHDLYARYRDHGQKGVVIQGLSGIDIALWDLKGKYFGQPIHRLMGGPVRDKVKAYATGLYRRDRPDHTTYLCEEALESRGLGYQAMKLKVGFGVDDDVRAVQAVREAIGPQIGLMIDANHAYDAVEAIRLGRRIEHHEICWFEEPVPPEDLDGHLRRHCRSRSPPANASSPASVSAACWNAAPPTTSSPICAPPAACRSARRSPTWRWPMACASPRMSGAPGSPLRRQSSCWRSLRTGRRRRSTRWSRCSNSTGPSTRCAAHCWRRRLFR
jgi:L-alanine-DL-glutamate epimerase-like enolase superfamily enzyme